MIFSAEIWANGGPCDKQERIPHRIVDTVTMGEGKVHLVVVLDDDMRRARRVWRWRNDGAREPSRTSG